VHIDPDAMDVVVFTRDAGGAGNDARFDKADDEILVAGTPAALRLSDIYEGVPVASPPRAIEKRPRGNRRNVT
jgi:hypothetical protein